MKKHAKKLKALGACEEGAIWADTQPSMAAVWRHCTRGDWMIWLIWTLDYPPSKRIPATVEIARTVEHLAAAYPAVARCNTMTLLWSRGEATDAELAEARAGAAGAAGAAWAVGAVEAAGAAGAARAAGAAGAAWAAGTAEAALAALAARAAGVTGAASLSQSADIVRKHFPTISLRPRKATK